MLLLILIQNFANLSQLLILIKINLKLFIKYIELVDFNNSTDKFKLLN